MKIKTRIKIDGKVYNSIAEVPAEYRDLVADLRGGVPAFTQVEGTTVEVGPQDPEPTPVGLEADEAAALAGFDPDEVDRRLREGEPAAQDSAFKRLPLPLRTLIYTLGWALLIAQVVFVLRWMGAL